jgi:hypothetical protein
LVTVTTGPQAEMVAKVTREALVPGQRAETAVTA